MSDESWLTRRAREAAEKIDTPHEGAERDDIAKAIAEVAREFAERVVRASLSEYEIHSRGVPERLIELTIAAAEKE